MPWEIQERDGAFCVVKKGDGKLLKCHPTREKAKSHLTALYVNEPSAAKKSMGYGLLKSLITERVEEIKGCGANKPGGGGFAAGNTCARGSGVTVNSGVDLEKGHKDAAESHLAAAKAHEKAATFGGSYSFTAKKASQEAYAKTQSVEQGETNKDDHSFAIAVNAVTQGERAARGDGRSRHADVARIHERAAKEHQRLAKAAKKKTE